MSPNEPLFIVALKLARLPSSKRGGAPRGDVDRSGGSEILGRLENIALLTVVERDLLHVVQREAPQIDLSVLGVAQLDAVVEHGHVVSAHRADVDGLQAAHAAIVLELHAREIADGIGHREAVQPLQVDILEDLRRDDLAVFGDDGRPDNDDLADLLDTVQPAGITPDPDRIGFAGRGRRSCGAAPPARNANHRSERQSRFIMRQISIAYRIKPLIPQPQCNETE